MFPIRCNICKSVRDWDSISVNVIDLYPKTPGVAFYNVKYCNDNPECQTNASREDVMQFIYSKSQNPSLRNENGLSLFRSLFKWIVKIFKKI